MSGFVVANVGELVLLDNLLKDSSAENWTQKQYKNDVTGDASSTASTFTQCDYSGYASRTLTRSAWSTAATVGGKATATQSAGSTTCTASSQTVYGLYTVGSTSGTLIYSLRFDNPRVLFSNDVLTISPTFQLSSEA